MCPEHVSRRDYGRAYAARQRRAAVELANARSVTCRRRFCGGILEHSTDGAGRAVARCPLCERRDRGICRDCPAPVAGRRGSAIRCARHKRTAQIESCRRHTTRFRDERNKANRRRYRANTARRREKLRRKAAWRKTNRDRVREQKRRYMARVRANPERYRYAAYHAEYRAARREQKAAIERARLRGEIPLRTCITPGCDVVLTHRKKKCARCKEAERQAAEQLLAPRRGRGRRTDLERVA